jgi:prepilin-type N-terminal cleavage/methylation domain-containing protein
MLTTRPSRQQRQRESAGFTLIELLVAMAVLVIIIAIAAPSFQSMMESNRLTAQNNELVSVLNLARSEAIRRRAPMSVCPKGSFKDGVQVRLSAECSGDLFHEQALSGIDSLTLTPASTTHLVYEGSGVLTTAEVGMSMQLGSRETKLCIRAIGRVEGQGC